MPKCDFPNVLLLGRAWHIMFDHSIAFILSNLNTIIQQIQFKTQRDKHQQLQILMQESFIALELKNALGIAARCDECNETLKSEQQYPRTTEIQKIPRSDSPYDYHPKKPDQGNRIENTQSTEAVEIKVDYGKQHYSSTKQLTCPLRSP